MVSYKLQTVIFVLLVTGLNVWISVFTVGIVCTFYTTLVCIVTFFNMLLERLLDQVHLHRRKTHKQYTRTGSQSKATFFLLGRYEGCDVDRHFPDSLYVCWSTSSFNTGFYRTWRVQVYLE